MIVDASAIVAIFQNEPNSSSVENALNDAVDLLMSSVTLTEVALAGLTAGESATLTASKVASLGIKIIGVDESMAIVSAEARHRYPIRFGDGFVYALAKKMGQSVLTLDAEFAKTDATLAHLT